MLSMTPMEEEETSHDPKTCMSQQAMHALFEMRINNMLCDATIRLEDDTSFNVHRAILCSCSNYFRYVSYQKYKNVDHNLNKSVSAPPNA